MKPDIEYDGLTRCRLVCSKREEGSRKGRCMWLWEDEKTCTNPSICESTLRRLNADKIS